jgi:hypothetical protein
MVSKYFLLNVIYLGGLHCAIRSFSYSLFAYLPAYNYCEKGNIRYKKQSEEIKNIVELVDDKLERLKEHPTIS